MFEAFLANTSTQGLSALGTAPQRSFELISGTVRNELGERHAAVFAEPVATQYGDRFDWYAAVGGKPRPLSGLDEGERAEVEADLATLLGEVLDKGQELLNSSDPDQQRLGEALANSVRYPGADCVYVLGEGDDRQPVLLNWAWVSDTQVAVTGDLSGTEDAKRVAKKATVARAATAAAAAPIAPPPSSTGQDRRARVNFWWLMWLGWLLLMLLIGAILYLMVEACALRIPGLPSYCPPPGPVASEEERRTLELRDRVAALEREIGVADRACQPDWLNVPIPNPNDKTDLMPSLRIKRLAQLDLGQQRLTRLRQDVASLAPVAKRKTSDAGKGS